MRDVPCVQLIKLQGANTLCTHINPMLAGKDSDQFGILVEGAKIFLVIDLGAIRVQVDGWLMVALLELLGHLGAYLLQAAGADGFLNVARDVLDLPWRRGNKRG